MKKTILLLLSALCAVAAGAKVQSDSLRRSVEVKIDGLSSSRAYQMSFVGVPLVAAGLIVKVEDDHFRSLRNDYLPYFSYHADDYMQYAPAALMLGLKAFGVEGRSSWGRMLTADAFSALLMSGVVNGLKWTTHVVRPDGSNDHSFPSGHTATAFMTATMLAKEYGHLSPWVSIGAYTVASSTGLMRMANNKHWLSDVLTGAGVGILSTEIAYWLADLVFRDRGTRHFDDNEVPGRFDPPSFVGLYLGMNVPLSKYDLDEQLEFRTSSGGSAGIEGADFFNPYIGLGGRFTVSNTQIIVNGVDAEDSRFDALSLSAGSYFSYPISSRWLAGGKLLGGWVHYPQLKLSERVVDSKDGFSFGCGTSFTYKMKGAFGVRFFCDWNLLPSHSRSSGEWMNTLTVGASANILL